MNKTFKTKFKCFKGSDLHCVVVSEIAKSKSNSKVVGGVFARFLGTICPLVKSPLSLVAIATLFSVNLSASWLASDSDIIDKVTQDNPGTYDSIDFTYDNFINGLLTDGSNNGLAKKDNVIGAFMDKNRDSRNPLIYDMSQSADLIVIGSGDGNIKTNLKHQEYYRTNIGTSIVKYLNFELSDNLKVTSVDLKNPDPKSGDSLKLDYTTLNDLINKSGTATGGKTTTVSSDLDSGITIDETNPNATTTDYKLSLNGDKIKELAGTDTLAEDLAKKANLDASNLNTEVDSVSKATAKDKWQEALGDGVNAADNKGLITGGTLNDALSGYVSTADINKNSLFTGIANGSNAGQVVAAGGQLKFFAGDNLLVSSDAAGIKYSLNKTLTGITSIAGEPNKSLTITAGDNKTYTFGDKDLGDTSVITNKELGEELAKIPGGKTTTVSTDTKSGIVIDKTNPDATTTNYKLSLDGTKIKELAKNFVNVKAKDNQDIVLVDNADVNGVDTYTVSVNVGNIANNNTFITNLDNNVAFKTKLGEDFAKLDGSNLKPTSGFKQDVWKTALGLTNSDIRNLFVAGDNISITQNGDKYTIASTATGGSGTGGGLTEQQITQIVKNYIGGQQVGADGGKVGDDGMKLVTHDVEGRETTNNKNIIAAINKINNEGIGYIHVNGSGLEPNAQGIAENDSSASGENAIAIGVKAEANGKDSIAIGTGNQVNGNNSGAIGDPTKIDTDNTYSVGNNNKVINGADDVFVLGNNVTIDGAEYKGAVVLGSGSTANQATSETKAEIGGITYGNFKGQATNGMILSVGASGAERQIKNVAAGKIASDSTDAVNGSQLYATNQIIGNVASSVASAIGGDAKVGTNGKISVTNIGGTGANTLNDAIQYVNNKAGTGSAYLAVDAQANAPVASVTKGSNSVAIGAGSSDNGRKNVVSVGNAKTGLNRTITNVAPGKYGTDAVNMNQLYGVAGGLSKQINDVKKKSSAGIAGAVALGMLPQSNIPGDALVSIGTGYHDSESAIALGISKTSDNARWIFKGGVSYDSQDEVTAGASVGFHF